MKKIFAILILLTLTVLAVFPAAAFASETSEEGAASSETTNLRLVNPVAICAIDNALFVADNITENNSIVLCFDISKDTPTYLFTTSVERTIVNLAETNGKLAVIYADGVDKYDVSSSQLTLNNEGSQIATTANIVDVTYGHITFQSTAFDAEFFIGNEAKLKFYSGGQVSQSIDTPNAIACLEHDGYVYFLFEGNNEVVCKRFSESGISFDSSDSFNNNTTLEITPKGIFSCQKGDKNELVLYSKTSFCCMTSDGSEYKFKSGNLLFNYAELSADNTIADACSNGNKVFVLNDKHEVEIFSQTQDDKGNWEFELNEATIGTDTITLNDALPQIENFNSYTLAKSTGYPTNIVYKTEDANTSITEVVTDQTDNFIILGFDGADELPFYYVLVGNRFGWVKKSDGATTVESDEKLTVISTNPVGVTQKAKFLSANSVSIYKLPITHLPDENRPIQTTFSQTLTTAKDVTVLQRFVEKTSTGEVVWYYVEYEHDGKTAKGFVQQGTIGNFYTTTAAEGISYEDDMKINASLFEGVMIYISEDLAEKDELCDSNGNVLKLRSGAAVKAIKKNADGTATYVEVTQNGVTTYGWVPTENLIDRHNVTTNAAVGLCILVAASFCALVLLLLVKHRNKKNDEFEED